MPPRRARPLIITSLQPQPAEPWFLFANGHPVDPQAFKSTGHTS